MRSGYAPEDRRRLAELKTTYDPGNIFRLNYSFPPSGQGA
ncbi:BBE domain-containing protein [Streptomyces sp. Ac-502]